MSLMRRDRLRESLSIPQLIQILQSDDCDDELTLMVEEELARRKSGGACQ
jgi:hypothetical protein